MAPRNTFAATRRSHTILSWLQNGEDVTIQRICDEFGIQYPQARADLKLLEELYDLSTYRDGRTKVWKWSGVNAPYVTFATAAALEFGGIALDMFADTPYAEEIGRIASYCRERVGRPLTERLDRISHALHLRRTWLPTDAESMVDHVEDLLDAIQLSKPIVIVYERADGEVHRYRVEPHNIIWYNGRLWLLAHHEDKDKLYDVAGIEEVEILRREDSFDLEAADPPEQHFCNAFGIFGGSDKVESIQMEVSGPWTNYFQRYRLHPSQRLEKRRGRVHVFFQISLCPEFKSFVLGMIPHVRVLEPAPLREELEDRVRTWLEEQEQAAAE